MTPHLNIQERTQNLSFPKNSGPEKVVDFVGNIWILVYLFYFSLDVTGDMLSCAQSLGLNVNKVLEMYALCMYSCKCNNEK